MPFLWLLEHNFLRSGGVIGGSWDQDELLGCTGTWRVSEKMGLWQQRLQTSAARSGKIKSFGQPANLLYYT